MVRKYFLFEDDHENYQWMLPFYRLKMFDA